MPPTGSRTPSYLAFRSRQGHVQPDQTHIARRDGPPDQADAGRAASVYVATAPERVVWASDWPHPTKPDDGKPDHAVLFDRLRDRAGSEAQFRCILVDNPASRYGFGP